MAVAGSRHFSTHGGKVAVLHYRNFAVLQCCRAAELLYSSTAMLQSCSCDFVFLQCCNIEVLCCSVTVLQCLQWFTAAVLQYCSVTGEVNITVQS